MKKSLTILSYAGLVIGGLFVGQTVWTAYTQMRRQADFFSSSFSIGRVLEENKDSLCVNTKNEEYFTSSLSREEGEKQLVELARTQNLEEMFAFLPSQQKWIELGYQEEPMSVRHDQLKLIYLLSTEDSVSIYHLHPGNYPYPSFEDGLLTRQVRKEFPHTTFSLASSQGITKYDCLRKPNGTLVNGNKRYDCWCELPKN
ncbi:MAG: hypothetical protein KC535_04950 [Nanoarchaeota archaeon]|nr:hypothetical protein [Nanoarchaeota archaeon]